MKYRKKPVVIDARQFTGDNYDDLIEWVGTGTGIVVLTRGQIGEGAFAHLLIPTLEGEMTANVGDWIIRGVKGEFYPCKPDIFAATYDAAAGEREQTPAPSNEQLREAYARGWIDRRETGGENPRTFDVMRDCRYPFVEVAPAQPPAPTPCPSCGGRGMRLAVDDDTVCKACNGSGAAPTLAGEGRRELDTERLDWLSEKNEKGQLEIAVYGLVLRSGPLRETIDAAMPPDARMKLDNRSHQKISSATKQDAGEVSGPTLAEGEAVDVRALGNAPAPSLHHEDKDGKPRDPTREEILAIAREVCWVHRTGFDYTLAAEILGDFVAGEWNRRASSPSASGT